MELAPPQHKNLVKSQTGPPSTSMGVTNWLLNYMEDIMRNLGLALITILKSNIVIVHDLLILSCLPSPIYQYIGVVKT